MISERFWRLPRLKNFHTTPGLARPGQHCFAAPRTGAHGKAGLINHRGRPGGAVFYGTGMNILDLTLVIWLGSVAAGFLGSLTGLGGGVVIVPLLTLGMGVNIKYAVGASLVSVIATSSGAAAAYVREGLTNVRIGMFLEVATTVGAVSGAALAIVVKPEVVAVVFGIVLVLSALEQLRLGEPKDLPAPANRWAARFRLRGEYGGTGYYAQRIPLGFGLMYLAGVLSGFLGIGSGALKVLAMDRAMRLPFKVSTTTSNFMIGVTAAASAGAYLTRGYIDPGLSMPVVLGVLPGAMIGTRVLAGARVKILRTIFTGVILLLGLEMIYSGFSGRF